jgi:aspartyl-tRNA(Asn)/glutamyl-tRNA(Gln) amidotransferase subunit A
MMAIVMSFEAATLHHDWLKSRPEDYAEQVRLRIEPGFNFSEQVYFDAISSRLMIQDEFLYACGMGLKNQRIDVVHVPTLQIQTPTISQTTVGSSSEILSSLSKVTHNTRGVNYLGLPAISVPAGFSSAGLPMAFQLIGRAHEEALLLKIADAYQSETSWHQKIPTLTH